MYIPKQTSPQHIRSSHNKIDYDPKPSSGITLATEQLSNVLQNNSGISRTRIKGANTSQSNKRVPNWKASAN